MKNSGKKTLLVVDDAITNRMIISGILSVDYHIVTAENGREAIDIIESGKTDISAMLLDIVMPVMDGFAVLDYMKKAGMLSRIPVIVITSSDDVDSQIRILDAGASDIVGKPFNPRLMLHRLNNIIVRSEDVKVEEQNALYEAELKLRGDQLFAAEHDDITGLYNRNAFINRVKEIITSAPSDSYVLSCLDVDNFKVVNDRFGHTEGNRLLQFIAQTRIGEVEQIGGIACRDTADIYLTLLPNNEKSLEGVTSHFLKSMKAYDLPMEITVHIGRYVIDDPEMDVNLMIDRALMAVRSVKGDANVTVAQFDNRMRETVLSQQRLVDEMRTALADGQFVLYYQPQYNYNAGKISGTEALVRWIHPERGLIPPGEFIPLFEKNGFIRQLDEYVWNQACVFLRGIIDDGIEAVPISVNISRRDISNPQLPQLISSIAEKNGIDPSLLHLEITESAYVDNPRQLISTVDELRSHGFIVEMDDFGSGYSSLNTLKNVYVDVLKLDMKFIEISDNDRGGSILSSVVRMAHWLKLPVIAEGVETRNQADYLKSIGCHLMQGYYFARPMCGDDYKELLAAGSGISLANPVYSSEINGAAEFLDASTQATLLFNSFVGGAMIVEYDGENAEVLRTNDRFFDVIGVDRDEYGDSGMRLVDRLYPESVKDFICMLECAEKSGEETSCELHSFPAVQGAKDFWTFARARFLAKSVQFSLFYISVENITERKELEQVRLRLDDIIHNVPAGIAIFKFDGKTLYPYYFSDRACDMFGYSREEYDRRISEGKPVSFMPDISDMTDKETDDFLNGKAIDFIMLAEKNDKTKFWMRSAASCATHDDKRYIYTTLFDISDRHRQEEELRVAREKLSLALKYAEVDIWNYDIATHTQTKLGNTSSIGIPDTVHGVPESILEMGIIAPSSAEEYRRIYREIQEGNEKAEANILVTEPNGDAVWRRFTFHTFFSDGKPVGAICVAVNISAENSAKARNRELELAIEGSSLYFWTYDRRSGVCSSMNKNAEMLSKGGNIIDDIYVMGDSVKDAEQFFASFGEALQRENEIMLHLDVVKCGVEWMRIIASPVVGDNNEIVSVVALGEDVSGKVNLERQYNDEIEDMKSAGGKGMVAVLLINLTRNIVEYCRSDVVRSGMSYTEALQKLSELAASDEQSKRLLYSLDRKRIIEAFEMRNNNRSVTYHRQSSADSYPRWVCVVSKTFVDPETGDLKAFQYSNDVDKEVSTNAIMGTLAEYTFSTIGMILVSSGVIKKYNYLSYNPDSNDASESFFSETVEKYISENVCEGYKEKARKKLSIECITSQLDSSPIYRVVLPVSQNGRMRWMRWGFAWLDDEKLIVSYFRSDVTEEMTIKERSNELNNALVRSGTYICELNLKSRQLLIPSALASQYGIPDIIDDTDSFAALLDSKCDGFAEFYNKIIGGEPASSTALGFSSDDGAVHWYDIDYSLGEGETAVITVKNITREKEQETENERNRVIIEFNNISIFDFSIDSEVMIIDTNLHGEGVVRRKIENFPEYIKTSGAVHKNWIDAVSSELRKASETSGPGTMEYVSDTWGNGFRWSRVNYVSLADESGKAYRVVGQITDIQSEKDREMLVRGLRASGEKTEEHLPVYDPFIISKIFQYLYDEADVDAAVNRTLTALGEYFSVSRAYVYEDDKKQNSFRCTFEWCSDNITCKKNPRYYPYEGANKFIQYFGDNGVFCMHSADELDDSAREYIKKLNIKSMLRCAIIHYGEFFGFIGFDDCVGEIYWSEEQIETLTLVSRLIGLFLIHKRERDAALLSSDFISALDDSTSMIYIMDPETKKIIFRNRAMREESGHPDGTKNCYYEANGVDSPCENCPVIIYSETGKSEPTEIRRRDGRWLLSQASPIRWDGRDMFMITCEDVTALKNTEEKLRMMTEEYGIVIRQSGKSVILYDLKKRTATRYFMSDGSLDNTVVVNVPYAQIEDGVIAPESKKVYMEFFTSMFDGEPQGEANVMMRLSENPEYCWCHLDYTLVFGSDGKPASAVISLSQNGEQLQKELAYRSWQENMNSLLSENAVYMEVNLTRNTIERSEGVVNERFNVNSSDDYEEYAKIFINSTVYGPDRDICAETVETRRLIGLYKAGIMCDIFECRRIDSGSKRWSRTEIRLSSHPYSGDVLAFITITDIDDEKRRNESLEDAATKDSMTKLYNRETMKEKAEAMLAGEKTDTCAMFMIDIDNFKQINDTLGHQQGDAVLISAADIIRRLFAEKGICARMGGDEFMVFISGISYDQTCKAGEKLVKALRFTSEELFITGSVGAVFACAPGNTFEGLYSLADRQLYESKRHGKNRCSVSKA